MNNLHFAESNTGFGQMSDKIMIGIGTGELATILGYDEFTENVEGLMDRLALDSSGCCASGTCS
jgi:hypothetical protein